MGMNSVEGGQSVLVCQCKCISPVALYLQTCFDVKTG